MNDSIILKTILLLAANPKGTVSLRLQEEEREIKERLRLAGYGKVPISSTGATRPRDLQQAMLDFKPQVVHFTGHGVGQDGLAFEDVTGQLKLVSSEALANLFQLFSERVECVVLNACYSEFQAKAISKHISYVIGMSRAIGDRAAIEFSVGFYTALGAGESIEFAYELGCNAIQLEGIPENLTPILLRKARLNRVHPLNNEHNEQQNHQSIGNFESPSDFAHRSISTGSRYRTVDEAISASRRRRKRYPIWVKIGLWTVHSRTFAWCYFWFCLLCGIGCSIAIFFASGFWLNWWLGWSIYGFFASLWYWAAIRWVDHNDHW